MEYFEIIQQEFDQLAVNGCIGDPFGNHLAYGYFHTASRKPFPYGRTRLRRQMMHLREATTRHGYRIPWDMLHIEVHSGSEFFGPALESLCRETTSVQRKADAVIVETLDRVFSRHVAWHQCEILRGIATKGVEIIFWQQLTLEERAIGDTFAEAEIMRMIWKYLRSHLQSKGRDFASEKEDDFHGEF